MTTVPVVQMGRTGPELLSKSLKPQQLTKHRAWIGIRVEALLAHFWVSNPDDPVKQLILADWMKALQNYQPSEITAACEEWISRTSRKPKPADIVSLILVERKKAMPVKVEVVAEREDFDSDSILSMAGIGSKRMGSTP